MSIKEIIILAKFSDDTVRQILITEEQKGYLFSLLIQTSKGGKIQVLDKPLDWIDIVKGENLIIEQSQALIKMVDMFERMRAAQKEYFRTGSHEDSIKAGKLEEETDRILGYLKLNLFNQ